MQTTTRDGYEFVQICAQRWEDYVLRRSHVQFVGGGEGGTSYRLGDALLSMEHTGSVYRYYICPNWFLF